MRINKKVIGLLMVGLLTLSSFAMKVTKVDDGAISATVNIAADADTRINLSSIIANSDKAGSIVQIQKADTTGVTTNYTAVQKIDLGDASAILDLDFYGDKNYGYRILVDGTSACYLSVTFENK